MSHDRCLFCGSSVVVPTSVPGSIPLCAHCNTARAACPEDTGSPGAPVGVTRLGRSFEFAPLRLWLQAIDHWEDVSVLDVGAHLPATVKLDEGSLFPARWTITGADGTETASIPTSGGLGGETGTASYEMPSLLEVPGPWRLRVDHRDAVATIRIDPVEIVRVRRVDTMSPAEASGAPSIEPRATPGEGCGSCLEPLAAGGWCEACRRALRAFVAARDAGPVGVAPRGVTIACGFSTPGLGGPLTILGLDSWPSWFQIRYHLAAEPLRSRWVVADDRGSTFSGIDMAGSDSRGAHGHVAFAGSLPSEMSELTITLERGGRMSFRGTVPIHG